MGPDWLAYRAGYALRRKLGLLRRATPAAPWADLPAPELRLGSTSIPPAVIGEGCVPEAEAVLRGEFRLFSHRVVQAGFPPDWHANRTADRRPPTAGLRHWSELSDAADGDIKRVWELSRFPWAFALARAFGRTGDERFKDAFWGLFADWCEGNPPNLGPNWMCGQEATFRLMAVVFAAEAMGVPEDKREALARFVVATGRRIAGNLGYALSQKNNHGVSECVGLITVALLVPEHSESEPWAERGLRGLERQLGELVYDDGGFSQHSLIYHRVLLHDLCWCRNRLLAAGRAVPGWLDAAGKRALEFLMTLTDPATGGAPLCGANDGSNVLPLADSEYLDMRPVVQMASAVFRRELPLPEGPWDEAAAWLVSDLGSLGRVGWPEPPACWHGRASGCLQLVNGADRLFLRCPERFRHRPSQADMLHVDVWHRSRPVAMDGGSFSYNSPERFTALGAAAQHNVLTVDGAEPMRKFSRFLYLPWTRGRVTAGQGTEGGGSADPHGIWRGRQKAESGEAYIASHDGYERLGIKWTRAVVPRVGGGFMVRDRVAGAAGRLLRWHWRLADAPWRLVGSSAGVLGPDLRYAVHYHGPKPQRCVLLRAESASAYGWWSPYYGEVERACSLLWEVMGAAEIEVVTEFEPRA